MELNEIYASIQDDLVEVRDKLKSISRIEFKWLSEQLSSVVKETGKGIRPALTLLSGKFYNYDLTYLLPMAVSVELMHTSTLVHDDAIDNAVVRRGQPTINKIWGEDIAVLMGDYLFAKAGEFVADTQTPRAVKLFSQTLATISSGEINQFLGAFKLEAANRENYFKRIYGKTASLFALATESGAILSQAPEESVAILKEYGDNLGIAFQIVDDILDFTSTEAEMGKPVGSDLTQGTITLPAILILERYPEDNPVKRLFETGDKSNVDLAIDMVRNSSIVEDCYQVARDYCEKACRNLSLLPESSSHEALIGLAGYIVKRRV
ncbi:polyprenyl synthetase family protein [Chloroflexota bacterium]